MRFLNFFSNNKYCKLLRIFFGFFVFEEFRECNISKLNGLINWKANETNCQNIFKEKSFEPLSLIFTKTYADDEKITYENLTISWSTKPPFKIYSMLKDECFVQDVLNKKHCIRTWLSINYAESSFNSLDLWLTCEDKSVKNWVKKYKKWWYKAQDWHFFYWDWGELGKSHYCTSELSSWSKKWCPFWKINFDSIFFNLKF